MSEQDTPGRQDDWLNQVRTPKVAKAYIADLKNEKDGRVTFSDEVRRILPEGPEAMEAPPFQNGVDIEYMKVDDDAHKRIKRFSGDGYSLGEVVAFFALMEALDRGDVQVASTLVDCQPNLLMEVLDLRSQTLAGGR